MKFKVKILSTKSINELDTYWSDSDYVNLLQEMNYPDGESAQPEELKELVYMSLTDFEPDESAAILLKYKLGDKLSAGQIQNISHDMMEDKVAEEYPDPSFHYDLFNINQLLYKAFNGTFPNTEASLIKLELIPLNNKEVTLSNEIILKALAGSLTDRSVILRLYEDQINGVVRFDDAAKIIWKWKLEDNHTVEILTSKYWLEKEDIQAYEYEVTVRMFEEDE